MTGVAVQIKTAIVTVRGRPVILANDLARFSETDTKSVNLYRKRNANKFTEDYAFQLSKDEWSRLRLQNETSKKERGGSRYLPWAYTEHGVAMMSMWMKSDNAVRFSKVIIDTFVSSDVPEGPLRTLNLDEPIK